MPLPQAMPTTGPGPIQADLFALCLEFLPTTPYPSLAFAYIRIWDDGNTWLDVATSNGVYSWTQWDAVLDAIPVGTKIIYAFGKTPNWASGTSNYGDPPTSNQYFWDFVTAVVNRNLARKAAGKSYITHWELWNEFNLSTFWTGTVAQMVAMVTPGYTIIKSLDPAAVVFNASTTNSTGATDLASYFAAGGAPYLDQVCMHAYTINAETLLTLIPTYTAVLIKYGLTSKQLWSTEGGYGLNANLPSDAARAGAVPRYYFLLAWLGVFSGAWYAYDTTAWGTLWLSGTGLTTAGMAYQQARAWFVGATPVSLGVSGTTWQAKLVRSGGYQGTMAWDTAATPAYTPPVGTTQYRDVTGTVTPYTSGTVTLGIEPLLFEPFAP